jgi:hypothetical protein
MSTDSTTNRAEHICPVLLWDNIRIVREGGEIMANEMLGIMVTKYENLSTSLNGEGAGKSVRYS